MSDKMLNYVTSTYLSHEETSDKVRSIPVNVKNDTHPNFLRMTLLERHGLQSGPRIALVVDTNGTQHEFPVYALMLQAFSIIDHTVIDGKIVLKNVAPAAVQILVNWMESICRSGKLFKVTIQDSFAKNVMLLKAAIELGIKDAERVIWKHLKSYTSKMCFEAQYLEVLNKTFDRDSPLVQHVAALMEWHQLADGLTKSAEAYIQSHPKFSELVHEKRIERVKKQTAKREARESQEKAQTEALMKMQAGAHGARSAQATRSMQADQYAQAARTSRASRSRSPRH